MEDAKPILNASEMAKKRWAAVSLEARREWSRKANAKRWAKVRASKKAKGK